MTSPMGRAPGDVPLEQQVPGWDSYIGRHGLTVSRQERYAMNVQAAATKRRAEAELVQVAVPAILADLLSSLPSLLHVVRLCDLCKTEHFKPRSDNSDPCNRVECECWCTQGTGN